MHSMAREGNKDRRGVSGIISYRTNGAFLGQRGVWESPDSRDKVLVIWAGQRLEDMA